jgi:acylphosphatase
MGMFDLIKLLSANQVDYVLVGGLAVALHGYARNTMDVDVVLAMDAPNLERFIGAAKAAGLHPVAPVPIESLALPELLDTWFRDKGMLAFGLRSSDPASTVIDVLIRPTVPYEQLRRDAVLVAVGTERIPLASIDHLIAMKTATGRSKDAIDIEELRRIKARMDGGSP